MQRIGQTGPHKLGSLTYTVHRQPDGRLSASHQPPASQVPRFAARPPILLYRPHPLLAETPLNAERVLSDRIPSLTFLGCTADKRQDVRGITDNQPDS